MFGEVTQFRTGRFNQISHTGNFVLPMMRTERVFYVRLPASADFRSAVTNSKRPGCVSGRSPEVDAPGLILLTSRFALAQDLFGRPIRCAVGPASVKLGNLRLMDQANRHARSIVRSGVNRDAGILRVFTPRLHNERAKLARHWQCRSSGNPTPSSATTIG